MFRPTTVKDKEWYPEIVYDTKAFMHQISFTGRYNNTDPSQEFNEAELVQRPTFLRLGVLPSAHGSAYMEFGLTKVLATVAEPREITQPLRKDAQRGKLNCIVRYGAFATPGEDDAEAKECYISSSLKRALEPVLMRTQYANMEFDVKAIVFDEGGCMMSTVINTSYAALVDAGVQTYDVLAASTLCIYKEKIFVNPDLELEMLAGYKLMDDEVKGEHGVIVVASFGIEKQISELFAKGFMSPETLRRLTSYAKTMNDAMVAAIEPEINRKIRAELNMSEKELEKSLQRKRRILALPEPKVKEVDEGEVEYVPDEKVENEDD